MHKHENDVHYTVVIPARYASHRLPGKPLCMIGNKPLIQHVYERTCNSKAQRIIIATDDDRIYRVAQDFGAEVMLTSDTHCSGTERICEVAEKLELTDDALVVNVQGDEFMLSASLIDQVAIMLAQNSHIAVATLCESITNLDEIFNRHIVKVVFDKHGYALYFSRSAIPFIDRTRYPESVPNGVYRHIGLYAYRVEVLRKYRAVDSTSLEQYELLEQLKYLYHGEKILIKVAVDKAGIGIDTDTDLTIARSLYQNTGS